MGSGIKKNMGHRFLASKKGDRVASTGTHQVHISKLAVSDWPGGLWLEHVGDVWKADYSIKGIFFSGNF